MARADDKIDELYQLPLDQFTPARNALAKELGDGSIKKLEKPNLAAWAVNQLYWRERKLYDEVIKTAEQLRTAYKQKLAGKPADVRAVEVFHNEAMRRAKDAIRRVLGEAGNTGADAVMTPIVETLDALPTTDPPGRLSRPLRRTGFEALQGVTIAARPKVAPPKIEPRQDAGGKRDREGSAKARGRSARAPDGQGAAAFRGSGGARSGSVARSREAHARARRAHPRTDRKRARRSERRGEGRA